MTEYAVVTSPTDLVNAVLYIHLLLMLEHWWCMNQYSCIMTKNFTTHAVLEMRLDVTFSTCVVLYVPVKSTLHQLVVVRAIVIKFEVVMLLMCVYYAPINCMSTSTLPGQWWRTIGIDIFFVSSVVGCLRMSVFYK